MIDDVKSISRLVAALLFAALCVLAVAVFAFAFREQAATRAAIAEMEAQAAALDVRLSQLGANGGKVTTDGAQSAWIAAPTSGVAAAAVQKIAGDVIAGTGGTVREVQVLDPDSEASDIGGPAPVSVVFLVETTHAGLRQILMGIEAAQPLLKTDKLSIEALPKPEGAGAEAPLRIEVRITGYWLKVHAS